jgi:Bifunctional DNA primase/polymerase, N-terminal
VADPEGSAAPDSPGASAQSVTDTDEAQVTEAVSRPVTGAPFETAALSYARRGWRAVPLHSWTGSCCTCGRRDCPSPAKHPRTLHGLKDATTDPGVEASRRCPTWPTR